MILAEALSTEPIRDSLGRELVHARALSPDSPKHRAMAGLLSKPPIPYFLALSEGLFRFLNPGKQIPLVFVTDWSDPSELIGLHLETDQGVLEDAELCFLGFYTDWDDLDSSGIVEIFAHELSHLWLSRMGFDFSLSPSNRFHTSTAITDAYMAFSEGFAEHFEMVTAELNGAAAECPDCYDHGFDLGAWLCARDKALRYHTVKNNRFLYHTAMPEREDFDCYQNLHMAHITSSAFMPERLKNGLQACSSEGLIASFFYRMYRSRALQGSQAPDEVYRGFGLERQGLSPLSNLYCKELCALSRIDLNKPSLFFDFVREYIRIFPGDKEEVLQIFAKVTNFVTVDDRAAGIFGELYRVGRRGNPTDVKAAYGQAKNLREACMERIRTDPGALNRAVYESVWVEGEKEICPVPWEPEHKERLKLDVNAATEVDFYALEGLSMEQCRALAALRESIHGFADRDAFIRALGEIRSGR